MTDSLHTIQEQILSVLRGGEILFIVPPFAPTGNPVLGVHLLQSVAQEAGYKTEILYLNVLLSAVIGIERFEYISFPPFGLSWRMLPERLFARSAYGLPPLGKSPEQCLDEALSVSGTRRHHKMFYAAEEFDLEDYWVIENTCYAFVNEAIAAIASRQYKIIGCTQREGQTNCSIALLQELKRVAPDTLTLIGGTNCKAELAHGIASLSPAIDYVFSGESEHSFGRFLQRYTDGQLPSHRIITGNPTNDLDQLPLPDYACFFQQTECFRGKDALKQVTLSYETSRGCWWGEKQKCRFCSEHDYFRQKSPAKVLEDVKQMGFQYQDTGIFMCDIVMPQSYQQAVYPQLIKENTAPAIYYQAKANLALHDLITLKKAGVEQFTIGIEAFSSGLLKHMNKGVSARQNLQLLRHARSLGMYIDWLLLWGFPGDRLEYYQETLKLLPLIRHFQPPIALMHLCLVRFSSYFQQPEEHGIRNIRPWAVYHSIYPEGTDIDHLAYWFSGEYACEAHEHQHVIEQIAKEIFAWQQAWETTHLIIVPFNECYVLMDNREGKESKQEVLEYRQVKEIMTPGIYSASDHQQWAIEKKWGVVVDLWYVPLITTLPELLLQFEEERDVSSEPATT